MVNRVQTVIYPALFSRATAFFTHCSRGSRGLSFLPVGDWCRRRANFGLL